MADPWVKHDNQIRYTLDDIEIAIPTIQWFAKSGTFESMLHTFGIKSLDSGLYVNTVPEYWDWLPTTQDQPDPFKASQRNVGIEQIQKNNIKDARLQIYKKMLISLRSLPDNVDKFQVDNNDILPAAKGSALYAFRMATSEILTESWGPWSFIVSIYLDGFWPCGVTRSNNIVVF